MAGVGVLLLAVAYPIALPALQERLGTRGIAVALLALLALSLPGRAVGRIVVAVGIAALLAAAALSADERFLRAVPAWVYAGLAGLFAASLRDAEPIIERAARWMIPVAPAFIHDYCRVVTALWAAFFLLSAMAIAYLAFAATPETWQAFTSRWLWLAMGIFTALEFFVRKTWFRYYPTDQGFDRFWSRLFPAERTARGRASMRAIRETRARLARAASASVERSPGA
jgi:uncharacterized membrane protein